MRRWVSVNTLEGARCSVEPAPRGELVRMRVNTHAGELTVWMKPDQLLLLAAALEGAAEEVRS